MRGKNKKLKKEEKLKQITLQVETIGRPDIDDLPKNEKNYFLSSLLAFIKEKKGEDDAV